MANTFQKATVALATSALMTAAFAGGKTDSNGQPCDDNGNPVKTQPSQPTPPSTPSNNGGAGGNGGNGGNGGAGGNSASDSNAAANAAAAASSKSNSVSGASATGGAANNSNKINTSATGGTSVATGGTSSATVGNVAGGSVGNVKSTSSVSGVTGGTSSAKTGASTSSTGAISNTNTAGSAAATSAGSSGNNTNINMTTKIPTNVAEVNTSNIGAVSNSIPCVDNHQDIKGGASLTVLFTGGSVNLGAKADTTTNMDCFAAAATVQETVTAIQANGQVNVAKAQAQGSVLTAGAQDGTCEQKVMSLFVAAQGAMTEADKAGLMAKCDKQVPNYAPAKAAVVHHSVPKKPTAEPCTNGKMMSVPN